jgi:hypothetical protein
LSRQSVRFPQPSTPPPAPMCRCFFFVQSTFFRC